MIKKQPTIWKNSVFVFLSHITRLVTSYVVFIFVARFYGPVGVGQFSLAFTVANLCLVFADFGFDVLLTVEIAKNKRKSYAIISKYFSMKVIFVGLGSLIMILVPIIQNFSKQSTQLIYSLVIYMVLTSFVNFIYAIFRGFEKFQIETIISFITNLILLVLLLFLSVLGVQLIYLMSVFISTRFIGLVIGLNKSFKLLDSRFFKLNFNGWRKTIKPIMIFGSHYLFGNLFFKLDTILLGAWEGDKVVGVYQSAFKIMVLLLLIPDILRSSVLPVASRLFNENKDDWIKINQLITKLLIIIAIPLSITVFFFAKQIIFILYGNNYFQAVPLLQLFAIIILIRFYAEPFGLMITTSNRQYIRMTFMIIATLLSYVLNYNLIPMYSAKGAAFASITVNLLVGIGYISVNLKYFLTWIRDIRVNIIISVTMILLFLQFTLNFNSSFMIISIISILIISLKYGLSKNEKELISKLLFKSI